MGEFNPEHKTTALNAKHIDKPIAELETEGWEYLFSFHGRIPEQWNMACEKADEARASGEEVALVNGQSEDERRDGVQYLYKRKVVV